MVLISFVVMVAMMVMMVLVVLMVRMRMLTGHQGQVISLSILQTLSPAITARPNLKVYFLMCWDYDNEEDVKSEQENCEEHQPGQEDDEGVEVEVGLALGLRLVIRPYHRQHCHALDIMIS